MKPIMLFLLIISHHFSFSQNWVNFQEVSATSRLTGDYYGYSVDMSGEWAISGAYKQDYDSVNDNYSDRAGAAYILKKDANGDWGQYQKLAAYDRSEKDYFGRSVAIQDDWAFVGAEWEDDDEFGLNPDNLKDPGSVYVYKFNGTDWAFFQKLTHISRDTADFFGCSMDVHGDYLVVGARDSESAQNLDGYYGGEGSAVVFKYDVNSDSWIEMQELFGSDGKVEDDFGEDVAIYEDVIVVGAQNNHSDVNGAGVLNDAGKVYVFKRTGETWNEVSVLVAEHREASAWFGRSVDIDGDYIVVGSYNESTDVNGGGVPMTFAGAAYVYSWDGMGWNFMQKLTNSDRSESAGFGTSVCVNGDYIVVGAERLSTDENGGAAYNGCGAAYIYHFDGQWTEKQKIVGTNREATRRFSMGGEGIAMEGMEIMIGARGAKLDHTGANPTSGFYGGKVYFVTPCSDYNNVVETTLCFGGSLLVDGNLETTSGLYSETFSKVDGCDSTITYNLQIKDDVITSVDTLFIDEGDSVLIDGSYRYTEITITVVKQFSGAPCDSLIADTVLIVNVDSDSLITPEYPLTVRVPNVFTPNNDGINDLLQVNGEHYSELIVFIYNRWGELLFENEIDIPWDGKKGNEEVPEGTYFCLIKGKDLSGGDFEYGNHLTLKR